MKKSRMIVALALVLMLVVSAMPAFAAGEKDVVYVMTNSAADKAVREVQVERFNATIGEEQGIEIHYTVYGENYNDMLPVALRSGEDIDLFGCGAADLAAQMIEEGYAVPYEEMPGGAELVAEYDGMLVNRKEIYDGKTYTLPDRTMPYMFCVNEDLFAAAGMTEADYPTTWDEVRECAKKITEAGNGEYYGYGLSLGELWTVACYFYWPASVDTGHVGFDNSTLQYRWEDFAPMAEIVKGIVDDGSVIPGFETLGADSVRAQFAEGRIGIMGCPCFDCGVYKDQFPAKCHWKVIEPPTLEKDVKPYNLVAGVGDLLYIGNHALGHAENCMTVLKYLYSDECMVELYEGGHALPIRKQVLEMATREPEMPGFEAFASVEVTPSKPEPSGLLLIEGKTFEETLTAYWTGTAGDDIHALLQDVDARFNAALNQMDAETLEMYRGD